MKIQRITNKARPQIMRIKCLMLLPVFLFSVAVPVAITWGAKARAAGSALGTDYGIKFDIGGKPIITKDSYILEWIDAGQLQITFKAGNDGKVRTEMFVPKNKKDTGDSPLVDQRTDTTSPAYEIIGWGCPSSRGAWTDSANADTSPITKMRIDLDFKESSIGDCQNGGDNNQTIDTKNPKLSIAWWQWVDAGTIENIKGSRYTGTFKNSEPKFPKVFVRTSDPETNCNDRLLVNSDKNEVQFYELNSDFDTKAPSAIQADGCKYTSSVDSPPSSGPYEQYGREIANKKAIIIEAGKGISTINTSGSTGSAGEEDIIFCEGEGISLSWILCPIISGVQNLVEKLNGAINNLMTLPTDKLFVTEKSDVANQFYASWSGFRYIAMGLLVIIALIMVLSQAIGVGPFDAYTIRKVLPRLLAAVVMISLSWPLMKLAVDITNGIGHSVSGLIYGPFSDSLTKENPSLTVMGGALLGIASGAFVFGIFGALAFVATAALSMLSGMATLIFREMLIMFLVVVAPVAIVCSILPNTQTVWKKWSDYFLRALVVFPIFSGVIAIGQVFASIGPTLHGKVVGTLIQFVGYFGPYFMLPKIFAMSGGAMAAFGAVAQKATAGMRGGLANYRKQKAGTRIKNAGARAKSGDFLPSYMGRVGGGAINRRVARVATGSKGRFGRGARGDAAENTNSETAANEFAKSHEFVANMENDNILRAAASGTTREEAIRNMQAIYGNTYTEAQATEHVDQASATIGLGRKQQIASAKQLVMTSTGYANDRQMTRTLGLAAGGNVNTANALAGFANAKTKQVGRSGLAPGYSTLSDMVRREMDTPGSVTAGDYHNSQDAALSSQGLGAIVSGKNPDVRNMVPAMNRRITRAADDVNTAHANLTAGTGTAAGVAAAERTFKQVMASTSSAIDLAGQLSPETGTMLADLVLNQTHTIQGQTTTNSRRIEHLRSDPEFGQMHREYGSQQQSQAAAAQAAAAQAAAAAAAAPPAGGPILSDSRLKRNIQQIGVSVAGIKVYKFQYIWSDIEYVGVLAQELLSEHRHAVIVDVSGYYKVDYSIIDVEMMLYKDWKHRVMMSN